MTKHISKLSGKKWCKVMPEQQTGDGTLNKPFQIPYREYSEEVNAFIKAVYSFEEQHPEYALNSYISILLINDIKWNEVEMSIAKVDELNGQAILALIMGAIRAERFCSGALEGFLKNGSILRWLHRLEEL